VILAATDHAAESPGTEFRRLRNLLNLTQHQTARIFGVDTSTPSRWERGQHETPRAAIIALRLAASATPKRTWQNIKNESAE
jgi:DNA-binding transcriptional regulator YiaG